MSTIAAPVLLMVDDKPITTELMIKNQCLSTAMIARILFLEFAALQWLKIYRLKDYKR